MEFRSLFPPQNLKRQELVFCSFAIFPNHLSFLPARGPQTSLSVHKDRTLHLPAKKLIAQEKSDVKSKKRVEQAA